MKLISIVSNPIKIIVILVVTVEVVVVAVIVVDPKPLKFMSKLGQKYARYCLCCCFC